MSNEAPSSPHAVPGAEENAIARKLQLRSIHADTIGIFSAGFSIGATVAGFLGAIAAAVNLINVPGIGTSGEVVDSQIPALAMMIPDPNEPLATALVDHQIVLDAPLPSDYELWIAHRPADAPELSGYFLTPKACERQDPTVYLCRGSYIGDEFDDSEYDLVIVAADSDTSSSYQTHLQRQHAETDLGNLVGDLLPAGSGAEIVASAKVQRMPEGSAD